MVLLLTAIACLLGSFPTSSTGISQFLLNTSPAKDFKIRISLSQCVATGGNRSLVHNEVVTYVLPNTKLDDKFSPRILDRFLIPSVTGGAHTWSMVVQDPSLIHIRKANEFQYTIKDIQKFIYWNPHAKFLIITTTIFPNLPKVLDNLFLELHRANVLHSVVLLPNNNSVFEAYAWLPFARGNCARDASRITRINRCSSGNWSKKPDLFPNKIPKTFRNCTVKVKVAMFSPFAWKTNDTKSYPGNIFLNNETYNGTLRGIDINLINLIAEILNLTVLYYVESGMNKWGDIFANGTITNNFKELHEGRDDLLIGFVTLTYARNLHFDYALYIQETYHWCVAHEVINRNIENISKIVHPDVLLITVLLFIVSSLVIDSRTASEWYSKK